MRRTCSGSASVGALAETSQTGRSAVSKAVEELVVRQILQNVIDQGLKSGETAFLIRSVLRLFGIGAATLNLGQRYLYSLFPQWIAIVPAIRRWNPILWKPAKAIRPASSSADRKDSLEAGR